VNEQEQYVPIENVAKHFSVSISTIRAWVRQDRIPKNTFMKLGTTYRFKLSAVEEALVGADSEPTEEPTEEPIKLY
jgi:excisionase family DNA binding protein